MVAPEVGGDVYPWEGTRRREREGCVNVCCKRQGKSEVIMFCGNAGCNIHDNSPLVMTPLGRFGAWEMSMQNIGVFGREKYNPHGDT